MDYSDAVPGFYLKGNKFRFLGGLSFHIAHNCCPRKLQWYFDSLFWKLKKQDARQLPGCFTTPTLLKMPRWLMRSYILEKKLHHFFLVRKWKKLYLCEYLGEVKLRQKDPQQKCFLYRFWKNSSNFNSMHIWEVFVLQLHSAANIHWNLLNRKKNLLWRIDILVFFGNMPKNFQIFV